MINLQPQRDYLCVLEKNHTYTVYDTDLIQINNRKSATYFSVLCSIYSFEEI